MFSSEIILTFELKAGEPLLMGAVAAYEKGWQVDSASSEPTHTYQWEIPSQAEFYPAGTGTSLGSPFRL